MNTKRIYFHPDDINDKLETAIKSKNINNFIYHILTNSFYSTFPKTYYKKKKLFIKQCNSEKSRSISEIYYMCKVYCTDVNYEKVIKAILKTIISNNNNFIYYGSKDRYYQQIIYCDDINKFVIHQGSWSDMMYKSMFKGLIMNYACLITDREDINSKEDSVSLEKIVKPLGYDSEDIKKEIKTTMAFKKNFKLF